MSRKRILIFSLAYFPKHVGGAEVAIKEITDRVSPEEYEFHMVCLRFDSTLPKAEKIGNVFVHRIGFTTKEPSMSDLRKFPLKYNKYLYQFLASWEALRLHRRYRFDGIWAMMAHSCGVPAAIFKTIHPEVGYNLTLQEGDPPEYIERLARPVWPLFVRAFRRADTIQCISVFLSRWAKKMGYAGIPVVIPNAVDVTHFSEIYPEEELNEIRAKIGIHTGETWMITTSRLVHKNAVDDVIRALASLPESVKFAVLGIGPDEEKLHALAEKLRVTERVRFLGQVGHADLPKYLKACDIFIRPSRSEGMGNSFVEAMAAELPVIATQEGGIADFLFDSKRNPDKQSTGWAVDRDSPAQIADAVRSILIEPDMTKRIVATAKNLVTEKYDWDIVARDMEKKIFSEIAR
jgi:glycosyltransferase involved in cell wall biosynthesis